MQHLRYLDNSYTLANKVLEVESRQSQTAMHFLMTKYNLVYVFQQCNFCNVVVVLSKIRGVYILLDLVNL